MEREIRTGLCDPVKCRPNYLVWLPLAFIIIFTVAVRVRLMDVPLERDEGEYAYTARLILEGIPPYAESYDLKMPGLHFAYSFFLTAFGNSANGIRTGLLIVSVVNIILMFFLGRRLFDDLAGVIAAAAFAVMSLSQRIFGFSANAEALLLLPAIGGLILLLRGVKSNHPRDFFLSGFLSGAAFIIKQPGFFFAAFSCVYLLFIFSKRPRTDLSRSAGGLSFFVLGAITPFILVSLLLLYAGVFDKFIFWTFKYAFAYGSAVPLTTGLASLKRNLVWISAPSALLWGLAAFGFISLLQGKTEKEKTVFLLALSVFSFLAVSLGLYFRPHYFILMFPAVALLSAFGAVSLQKLLSAYIRVLAPIEAAAVFAAVAIMSCVYAERAYLFHMTPLMVSRATYGPNPFIESLEIARYIRENTSESDRIAVIGSEPQIYFYSGRRAATRYIVMYPLTGEHDFSLAMQKEMIGEIEAAQPEMVVFVKVNSSWSVKPKTPRLIFEWLDPYLEKHFRRVGIVDILTPEPTEYYWDDDSAGYKPRSARWISIFRKND